jgi:hypothetical protein
LNIPCQNCHTAAGWKPVRNVPEFDHNKTSFPLRGMHEGVACTQCHTKMVFTNVGTRCADCHADIHRRQFGANCEQCHNVKGWNVGIQQVKQHENRFPLVGAHAALDCESCHKGAATGQFLGLSTQCYSCHATDYQKTSSPAHAAAGFSTTCEQCHSSMDNWSGVNFDHLKNTGFSLVGAHATLQCSQCHINNQFKGTPATCVGCHMKDFQGTTHPNHVKSGFPQTCQQCHTTTAWIPATFDHNTVGFSLTGAHATVPCAQCHVNNNYNLTSANTACVNCHLKDFQATNNPNHTKQGFAQTCQTCHSTTAWTPATFDHNTVGFPLTGAHTTVQCTQCHVNNNYQLTVKTCVSCHLKNYQTTTNPNHAQQGFAQTCETCHNTAAWQPASFNHANSGFPLTGAHATVQCAQCHINNNYNLTSANTACVSCHLKNFQSTTSPNHVQANFPQTCQQCHNTTSWGSANWDHSSTGFALTGAHTTLQCALCHINNNYSLTSANTTCVSCHLPDYQKTTEPNHVQANFPQTCQQCHNTTSWGNANWNHSSTGFTLVGAHSSLQCAQCHVNGNYTLTSANTTCVSCHLADYQKTTNPNHVQANFPQTCQQCHNTTSWGGANWDHSSTGFALTGIHATTPCAQCHVNGNYNLTSANTTCVGCHLKDFQGTTSPNHVQAGFPQTCQQCHNTSGWGSANWNHSSTGFALTGTHATTACQQCHVNNNYSLTSANAVCSACHMNVYNTTNSPPHAQVGYPTTCDVCHDTVKWADGTFNHNNTAFPLTGFHATSVTCAQCHVNNNYTTLPTVCSGCHMTDYNGTNNPNHAAAKWPTTCNTCHNTTAWIPANLPTQYHTFFPVNHGGANGVCSTCHQNQNDYSVFQCTNCHTKTQTDSNHHGVSGYVYNSVNCYNCHKNGSGG